MESLEPVIAVALISGERSLDVAVAAGGKDLAGEGIETGHAVP